MTCTVKSRKISVGTLFNNIDMIGFNNTTWASLSLSGVTCYITMTIIMFRYSRANSKMRHVLSGSPHYTPNVMFATSHYWLQYTAIKIPTWGNLHFTSPTNLMYTGIHFNISIPKLQLILHNHSTWTFGIQSSHDLRSPTRRLPPDTIY